MTIFPLLNSESHESDIITPNVDGNASANEKNLALTSFSRYVDKMTYYSAEVGKRIQLKEVNIFGRDTPNPRGQTVFEIEVSSDMCNVHGTLHGACSVYIMDPCALSCIVALGSVFGVDGSGVSQSMHIIWHQPAHVGSKLRVVSDSVFIDGRIRTARCELWDKNTQRLYVSAVHSTVTTRTRSDIHARL